MCKNIGTPENINFPFGTNGKLMVLGVPILKHFMVLSQDVPSYFGEPFIRLSAGLLS